MLHATVVDDKGQFVPDLTADNFRVFEDKVEQKISVFSKEDIPVTMGLVIDNSGSMKEKRAAGECCGAFVCAHQQSVG